MRILRRPERRLARTIRHLRRDLEDAQRIGDVDAEYQALCLIAAKTAELHDRAAS
ncbi:MAG TPA: hypothetical protein VFC99_04705 [Acidimicrobiia bacterium]|nr:hypothetical protein [Acidimicrobiia bacterium]